MCFVTAICFFKTNRFRWARVQPVSVSMTDDVRYRRAAFQSLQGFHCHLQLGAVALSPRFRAASAARNRGAGQY